MAQNAEQIGYRVVFLGSHKQPNYIVDTFHVPQETDLENGEILVKVNLSTICPEDLLTIKGNENEAIIPCVLGHEGVGEVVYCKQRPQDDVRCLRPGDRIIFCVSEKCERCNKSSCHHQLKYGQRPVTSRLGLSGTFSSHIILNERTQTVKVPHTLPDRHVAPVNCALATIMKATRPLTSLGLVSHDSIAVIQGCGLYGIYTCAALREAGYRRIYCQDIKKDRLPLVPKFGGIPVLVKKYHDNRMRDWPSDGTVDVVIEACGDKDVFPLGVNLLRHGGTYVLLGLAKQKNELSLPVNCLINKCLTIRGSSGYSVSDLKDAIEFLERTKDKHPYNELLSPNYAIQDFHSAIRAADLGHFHRIALLPSMPLHSK